MMLIGSAGLALVASYSKEAKMRWVFTALLLLLGSPASADNIISSSGLYEVIGTPAPFPSIHFYIEGALIDAPDFSIPYDPNGTYAFAQLSATVNDSPTFFADVVNCTWSPCNHQGPHYTDWTEPASEGDLLNITISTSSDWANGLALHYQGGTLVAVGTPEPSTWAMLLIGFVGVGLAAFRRKQKFVVSAHS